MVEPSDLQLLNDMFYVNCSSDAANPLCTHLTCLQNATNAGEGEGDDQPVAPTLSPVFLSNSTRQKCQQDRDACKEINIITTSALKGECKALPSFFDCYLRSVAPCWWSYSSSEKAELDIYLEKVKTKCQYICN